MIVRSAKNKETGKFHVTCFDWNGGVFFEGAFDTLQKADFEGAQAERRMTMEMMYGPAPASIDDISDDELLAILND